RPLSLFSIETHPIAIGILADRSISVGPVRNALSKTVSQICKALGPDDQAFLMTFSTASKLDVPLTTDHDSIISTIRRTKAAPGTRFYDAAIDGLDELARSSRGRKALVILTDGADHYSDHPFQQTLDIARLYGIPINILAYPSDDGLAWTASGRREIQEQLQALADAAGG